ncbi:MAG TPA: hypothetical protein VFE50_15705 [Cyclobacteriaceae bacterium]|nr:hypothetical protein [Cyclobacteriaceae bacterium]
MFLLRMKAWQLFIIMLSPLFFQVLAFIAVGMSAISGDNTMQDKDLFYGIIFMGLTGVVAVGSMILLFSWFYVVSMNLHAKLPNDHNLKIVRFRMAFFFPMIYICVVVCVISFAFLKTDPSIAALAIIIPFHFLAMFCMFYVLYFTSKSLKIVELQRNVTFSDFAGEFVLIWLFFIGVWIIQPRINKIFAEPDYGGESIDRYLK